LKAFFEGMQFPSKYKYAKSCRENFSLLLNDFHFMQKNHTTSNVFEDKYMNITGVISGPF